MQTSLDPASVALSLQKLGAANRAFAERFPGEPASRQPVHTVYGGAHLFKADTAPRLGSLALAHLDAYAPDAATFGDALGLPADPALRQRVYDRTREKLQREPVEDFRIDFEDGYGNRPWDEEDDTAVQAARQVALGLAQGSLPPFIGIRVKPLTDELAARSLRTLDIFLSTLLDAAGQLPPGFLLTLPKVTIPEQVTTFVDLLDQLEQSRGLPAGSLKIELMIETTQAIVGADGRVALPGLLHAARGRCTGAHLGTYDFTASANITAMYQAMAHPVCDFAKHMMTMSYAATGIFLSDGATNVMPVGPHREGPDGGPLTDAQQADNRAVVHAAWKLAYDHVRHSLAGGYYQGWDLHPGQLSVRYAACYAFFLEGLEAASARLSNFVDKAAQATLVGDVFDDAATGQGLLNYFLRALNCGAISLAEVEATGLTREEVEGRSFLAILENRRSRHETATKGTSGPS